MKNTTTGQTVGSGTVTYNEGTSGPITPGASPGLQFSFTLPDGVAGTGQIQFTVTTNAGNTVAEGNPGGTASTNNTAAVTITSALASYPDLQVTNVAVAAPSGMVAGGTYVLSWDDANNGAATTPAGTSWNDQVTITNMTTGTTLTNVSVPYNAAPSASGPIAAGGAHLQQYSFTLPGGTAGTGQIQFTVVVNANQAVFESNAGNTASSNNSASIIQPSALGNYPDLQVTGLLVTPSSGLQSGGGLTVNWNDSNTGTAAAATSWVDSLLIQNKTTGQTLGTVTLPYNVGANGNAPLATGQAAVRQYMYTLPDGAAGVGQIAVTVTANSTNSLFEYNTAGTAYSNDTASVQASSAIAPYPDLQVQNIGISPTSIYSGASFVLHWQDVNTGNAAASTSWDDRVVIQNLTTGQTISTSTLVYDVSKLGTLAGGSAGDQQLPVTLPAGMASVGTLQFSITTDVLGQVFEYNSGGTGESNNTATITAVSGLTPAADLEVTGLAVTPSAGLQSGSSVVFSWNDVNQGDAATTGSWVDAVTVTNQKTGATVFTAVVPYDGSATGRGPLGMGGSAAQQVTVQIPQGDAGAGQLVFQVVTDSTRTIPDYTSTGAVDPLGKATTSVTSALAPYPDLAVSNVSAPALTIGDPATVTVGWTVTNSGTAATQVGNWVDTVIASPDNTPGNGDDIILGTFSHVGVLGMGQSYTQSQTFLLPPAFNGQYHLFVHTDAGNAVFENGDRPDRYAQPANLFDVTQTPYADLVVSSVNVPATAASGQSMTVSWSVLNQGIGVTSPSSWGDSVSLATDPQGQHIIEGLGSYSHNGSLAPGGSYSRSASFTLPDGISGTYYIVVHTGGPYEFLYTGNNTGVSAAFAISLTPPPNLTVTSIQTPATVVSGGSIDVAWTVKNLGPGDADGLWPDIVSLQEIGGAGRQISLGAFAYTATLAAGKSYTRTEEFTLPTDFQGIFQAVVSTDPVIPGIGRDQFEVADPVDTTVDPQPITITQPAHPDLQVASITPAASHFQAGATLGLQFVVINQGTVATTTPHWTDSVYLSLDSTLSEDDILLSSAGNQSALEPGQTYQTALSSIPIPKTKSGSYYLIVDTNSNGAQDEYPNNNNNTLAVPITIDPILPSDLVVSNVIVPAQAVAGSQIQVTYTVTNLGNGPTDLSSWTDGIWLANDRKLPYVTGTLLTTVTETGVLTNDPHNPDLPQSYTQTVTVTLPQHLSGQLFITPQTDLYEQLDQTTLAANVNPDDPNDLRSDNFKAAPIIVLPEPPPDLVVTAIKVPASAAAGTVYPVQWTVTDQGNGATEDSQWFDGVYLSNSPTYNTAGDADRQQINLGYFLHTGALSSGQSYTMQENILLSPAYSGDYIIIYANELNASGGSGGTWEGPYGNNNTSSVATDVVPAPADLQVTSVIPAAQAFSGESTTVTWTVTNFGRPSGPTRSTGTTWFMSRRTQHSFRAGLHSSKPSHTRTRRLSGRTRVIPTLRASHCRRASAVRSIRKRTTFMFRPTSSPQTRTTASSWNIPRA